MFKQDFFNRPRGDVLPRLDDEVFFPVRDPEVPVLVHVTDISGVEPAAPERFGGFLGLFSSPS